MSLRQYIHRENFSEIPSEKGLARFKIPQKQDGQKPTKSPSTIGDHLLNNPECSKNYNENRFKILTKGRNMYHLSVL